MTKILYFGSIYLEAILAFKGQSGQYYYVRNCLKKDVMPKFMKVQFCIQHLFIILRIQFTNMEEWLKKSQQGKKLLPIYELYGDARKIFEFVGLKASRLEK